MRLIWPSAMRTLDQRTSDEVGLPAALLMESAGRAVADAIARRLGAEGRGRLVTVLCGAGNNGGDGFVVARELLDRGYRVHAYAVGDPKKLSPAASLHHDALCRSGLRPRWAADAPHGHDQKNLHRSLLRSVAVVDALLGIGPSATLREPLLGWVTQLDGRHDALKVAIDLPSGLDGSTGKILGAAARVDLVVACAAAKPGLWLGEGPSTWKELEIVDIGVPRRWLASATPEVTLLDAADARALAPARPEGAHKGTFGHLLVVAGSPGRTGAALLAAQAGLRAGAGLLTLATHGEVRSRLEGQIADLMVEAIRGGAAEAARVLKLLAGKDALVVGPGLGTGSAELDLCGRLCDGFPGPIVLDADALTALADKPELAASAKGRLVLTPHPGEAARLLGSDVASVEADRLAAARALGQKFGAVVVLKGARTLIVDGEALAICGQPQPALAVGGSGDVLAGVIGGLLAQGVAPFAAAKLGVHLHNRAGAALARRLGARASTASDLLLAVATAWGEVDGVAVATADADAGAEEA